MLHPSFRSGQSVRQVLSVFLAPHDISRHCSRMQTLEGGLKRPSTVTIIRASIAQSGFRSLYTGLTASLMRQMSYSLVRLGTYEDMKARISRSGPPSTPTLILMASFAGILGGIAGNPAGSSHCAFFLVSPRDIARTLDILLVRMTSDSIRPPDKRYGYPNAFTGLISLIKEEGLRGLARGLTPNTVRRLSFSCYPPNPSRCR